MSGGLSHGSVGVVSVFSREAIVAEVRSVAIVRTDCRLVPLSVGVVDQKSLCVVSSDDHKVTHSADKVATDNHGASCVDFTRYYGVFAKASKNRDKQPDRPPPKPDDPNASSNQPTPPHKNKLLPSSKRPGGKKGAHKISWAALLRRMFAIDVLQCGKLRWW